MMKTLIAYATKHGATRKYAQELARELPGEVTLADLHEEQGVDVSAFDQVILGGAIYYGQVRPELKEFCARNLDTLPQELHEVASAEAALGGELTLSRLNFGERLISRMIGVKSDASRYDEPAMRKFAAGW